MTSEQPRGASRGGPQQDAGARGAELVRIEAAALERVAGWLEHAGQDAFRGTLQELTRVLDSGHRVVVSGIGKSGLIARKIAATLISLGIPALFLHPAEALHGDLGLLSAGDALLVLSYSGETEEILRLLPILERMGVVLLSLCGCPGSTLVRASRVWLDASVDREACTHQLAPTASTTAMLALGDALAVELARGLGFAPQSFAELHPGGQLGRRLTPVRELMHAGAAVPVVRLAAALPEMMHEMSAKRLGMTTVQQNGRLVGVLSDGDLRRLMERDGPEAFHRTAGEVMTPQPRAVAADIFANDALEQMEAHRITSLVVTEGGAPDGVVLGVVHMHDLLQLLAPASARAPGR